MKTDRKADVQRWRENHHKSLEALARQVGCNTSGLVLWRQLSRIERGLYAVCESYTCGPDNQQPGQKAATSEDWEAAKEKAKAELAKIFGGTVPAGVFINSDPRGHMLKLDPEKVTIPEGMHTDWGRNGILAATIE